MRNVDDDDDVVVACDDAMRMLSSWPACLPSLPPRAGVAEDGDDGR